MLHCVISYSIKYLSRTVPYQKNLTYRDLHLIFSTAFDDDVYTIEKSQINKHTIFGKYAYV